MEVTEGYMHVRIPKAVETAVLRRIVCGLPWQNPTEIHVRCMVYASGCRLWSGWFVCVLFCREPPRAAEVLQYIVALISKIIFASRKKSTIQY